jgi:lysyl-tRNA synthetase class 2
MGQEEQNLSLRDVRVNKLRALETEGVNAYPHIFKPSESSVSLQNTYKDLPNGESVDTVVKVAGRIRAIRNSGMFIDIEDEQGKIQIYTDVTAQNQVTEMLKSLDIGDIIGIEGNVRRTKRGELSIAAQSTTMLAKSLQPLPDKWNGLEDKEVRYRQRYLDIIVNKDSKDALLKRSRAVATIREVMADEKFVEVETPILHPIKGGANARPFETYYNALDSDFYLRIASELYLKRLIVGGIDRVFEIGKTFRNEGIDTTHLPEFTMLDLYRAYADYNDMMTLSERLLRETALSTNGALVLPWNGNQIDLSQPFRKLPMVEAASTAIDVDMMAVATNEEAVNIAKAKGIQLKGTEQWGEVVEEIFNQRVEKTLIQPTFVTDIPRDISPLAKQHRTYPRLAERFMLHVGGMEFGEAYSELTNPLDQRTQFEKQVAQKDNEEAQQMDEDFVTALEHGMPPTGGMGIGIDRLAMMLTNSPAIRDIITFPALKIRHRGPAIKPDNQNHR